MVDEAVKIISFLSDYFNESAEIINPYLGIGDETEMTAKIKSLPHHIFRYSSKTGIWLGSSIWQNQQTYSIKASD